MSELQWCHETLLRLIGIVQRNGLVSDRLHECVVAMSRAAVLLEGLIQEQLNHVRRRKDDQKSDP